MFIGMDILGFSEGSVFDTKIAHTEYNSLEIKGGLVDHIFVDEDIDVSDSLYKNNTFSFTAVMIASLDGNLEAGSIYNNGIEVDRIRFQKRRTDELYWTDVAELKYNFPEKKLYEALDKYIQNDFEYEYSLLPVTDDVLGLRVKSEPIVAKYDGFFVSDKVNNIRLLFNAEMGGIDHSNPHTVFDVLDSRFPIISYGNSDYRQSSISAVLLTPSSYDKGSIDIRSEKNNRDNIMRFLKNRKPKIFRGQNGEIMLITIIDNPKETPNKVTGVFEVSFGFVEIGEISSTTLRNNGLIEGLSEV